MFWSPRKQAIAKSSDDVTTGLESLFDYGPPTSGRVSFKAFQCGLLAGFAERPRHCCDPSRAVTHTPKNTPAILPTPNCVVQEGSMYVSGSYGYAMLMPNRLRCTRFRVLSQHLYLVQSVPSRSSASSPATCQPSRTYTASRASRSRSVQRPPPTSRVSLRLQAFRQQPPHFVQQDASSQSRRCTSSGLPDLRDLRPEGRLRRCRDVFQIHWEAQECPRGNLELP